MTVDELKIKNFVITDCIDENRHLLFSLHNLPRVYLSKGVSTLFELRGAGIGENDALQYSKSWMNEEMLRIYEDFL